MPQTWKAWRGKSQQLNMNQKAARLLPARNASRGDAQAGEDGLFGFLRPRYALLHH